MSTTTANTAGLAGVVAGDTEICSVEQGGLLYRGYEIADLAQNANFEQVSYLLLVGHKPNDAELKAFTEELAAERHLPELVDNYILSMKEPLAAGTAAPMDVLRSAVSILGNLDPEAQSIDPDAELRKSKRLLAKIPVIIGHCQNVIDGVDLVKPDPTESHAGSLLTMIRGGKKATPEEERIVDVSLILYAEHDYNASTFTSRVIAGTLSDLHGAVTGAIAALKGPLHGGANEAAMEMLKEVDEFVSAGKGSVEDWLRDAFVQKKKLMGFGHRVYKNGDHRAGILHELGRAYTEKNHADKLKHFEHGEAMMKIMAEEKTIFPNVDVPCGMTYYAMGIPVPQYTPIFVAARITGWAAHVMEQHANNRLIRPVSNYTGPAQRSWNG
ncbi:MAG: citrate/2-methylcitrate synthase [Planctomycetota bacterium]